METGLTSELIPTTAGLSSLITLSIATWTVILSLSGVSVDTNQWVMIEICVFLNKISTLDFLCSYLASYPVLQYKKGFISDLKLFEKF